MRVRVVEARQDSRTPKVDHARARALEPHHLGPAGGHHSTARNRKMAVRLESGAPERANHTAGEDQVGFHARRLE